MKLNIVGIIGGIIAFVSLFFPWWTMTLSETMSLSSVSETISIYPYQVQLTSGNFVATKVDIWYGWVALVLVVIAGLLGLAGSIKQKLKGPVVAGGILTLLAIMIFAVGLQNDLSNSAVLPGWPAISLFGSGTFEMFNYAAYLNYGLWLALAAAIIMLVASLKKLEATVTPATPTSSPQTAPQITSNEPT